MALLLTGCSVLALGGPLEQRADRSMALERFVLVATGGVEARLESSADGEAKVTFVKGGPERRLVALESRPVPDLTGARSLQLRCRILLKRGAAPRGAVVFFRGEGVWFKLAAQPWQVGEWADCQLPVELLRTAAFSGDQKDAPDRAHLDRVWLGFVIEGQAEGSFEVARAGFSSQPYRPAQPLAVPVQGPDRWSVSKDQAVWARLTTPDEGPDGRACMELEFTFPGGRHMYVVPSVALPGADLDGYGALRLTYKASLPDGIGGLLVLLCEDGGAQYYAEPAPPPSAGWTTVEIPWERFRLGTWTADANGKLDLDGIRQVAVGAHGTATAEGGAGGIWAADVEFVP